jgi:cytochrome c-type biogenesis protein CcmF
MMAMGIIGIDMFQTETQGTIKQGESLQLSGYTITFRDLAVFDTEDGRNVARAVMDVAKGGRKLAELHPRRDYYYAQQQPMTIPGVRSSMEDDVYVLLVDWQPISSSGATFKVYHNPLVNWLWVGCLMLFIGSLVAAWPDKEPEPSRARAPARDGSASQV